jgi:hypothetical protein
MYQLVMELNESFQGTLGKTRRFNRDKRRHPPTVSQDELDRTVINISPFVLTESHKLALHKGLNYAIKPTEFPRRDVLEGFNKFRNRVLKTTSYSNQAKAYTEQVGTDIQNITVRRSAPNLSSAELTALKDLQAASDKIVIKPADKGRAIVVWDRGLYVSEIRRQLDDSNTYRREPHDLTPGLERDIAAKLQQMERLGELRPEDVDRIIPRGCRTPPIYGLPKIHKLPTPINYSPSLVCKARPIIGAVGCTTERISAFVDEQIRPLAQAVPSYLKDTTHFLNRLTSLQEVPQGSMLVTADVTSLYPSIPHKEGLIALRSALDQRARDYPSADTLVKLAEVVLTSNHFTFDGQYYTQTSGTAMGTKFAPSYAIIFMGAFEQHLLQTWPDKPLCWYRFIDDIFFIWPHGETKLRAFMECANAINKSVQLTFEHSQCGVSFLDTQVNLVNGRLVTDLYRKPTDTQQYLHFDSCHPKSQKLPIAYSQALRINKICSNRSDAIRHCNDLKQALVRRGYPKGPVDRYIRRALRVDRISLIFPPPKEPEEQNLIPLVIPYHPDVAHIQQVLQTHLPMLQGTNISTKVYWQPPKRISRMLVSSNLRSVVDRPLRTQYVHRGMRRCGKPRCLCCKQVSEESTACSTKTNLSYRLPASTCSSNNVVYLLHFKKCGTQYIGQTERNFNKRLNDHRSAVKLHKVQQPFAYHFKKHKYSWEDVHVTILEQVEHKSDLDRAESFWISQFMTDHPFGLNIQNVLYRNVFTMDDIKK